ncbi:MAG: TIGR03118 family protein [Bacteroidetes bacterium]|nr:TIGR03118 family protein [Bacteroidota bacterium]
MNGYASWLGRSILTAVGLALAVAACKDNTTSPPLNTSTYTESKLVADDQGAGAAIVDVNLVNPWGLAFGATGTLWVSNNHSGTSTLYDATGAKLQTVVNIPSKTAPTGGSPTGVIYNSTADFVIPEASAARFIYAGEDGTISAWASGMTDARIVADRSASDAVYKGIAMATNGGSNFIYLTNFKKNTVDVFDATYRYSKSFTDATIPAGYAPFGIQNIGGMLYVTYAKQKGPDNEDDDPAVGNGYVDIFNADGTLQRRFASNGLLNSPWAVVMAPSGFGSVSGDILIGNFGDGHIGAYDPGTGVLIGQLRDQNNITITIEGLWALTFGPSSAPTTLYFAAGPGDEEHGLLGTLTLTP